MLVQKDIMMTILTLYTVVTIAITIGLGVIYLFKSRQESSEQDR